MRASRNPSNYTNQGRLHNGSTSLRIFHGDKAEKLRSIIASRRDTMQISMLDIKDERKLGRSGNREEVNLILSYHELEREVGEWEWRGDMEML